MVVQMSVVSELEAYTFCGYTIKHPVYRPHKPPNKAHLYNSNSGLFSDQKKYTDLLLKNERAKKLISRYVGKMFH